MIHPLELQRRNMIEYQQIDIQGNALFKEDGTNKVPDYVNNLFMEEYKEKLQAEKEGNREKLADAYGDMLICIAGGIIEHIISPSVYATHFNIKISLEMFCEKFRTKPFEVNDVIVIHPVEKIIQRFNEAITLYEKAILFGNLWFSTVNEAKQNNFDIENIYNAIAENNLIRIDRDEEGKPKTYPDGKIMRKNIHPDLTSFIL